MLSSSTHQWIVCPIPSIFDHKPHKEKTNEFSYQLKYLHRVISANEIRTTILLPMTEAFSVTLNL
jgi:hypothetical protein